MNPEPFVGRRQALERLHGALDDARSGRGRVVMLVGEPGIGKTRLAEELEHHAIDRGARVLWGRSHEASGAPPYWPWVEVIRAYASSVEPDELREQLGESAAEVVRMVPQLRERLPDIAEPQPVAATEYAQFLLFDAVTGFLRRAAIPASARPPRRRARRSAAAIRPASCTASAWTARLTSRSRPAGAAAS